MAYGTDTGLTDYLALDGRTLPAGAVEAQVRYAGSRYIDGTYECRFYGTALSDDASFPRDRWPVVPERVEQAAYEAGLAWANDPASLSSSGVSSSGVVKREKVEGAVEVEYAVSTSDEGAVYDATPMFTVVEGLLQPYMRKVGGYRLAAFVV